MAQLFTPLRTITATGVGAIAIASAGRRTLSIYDSEEPEIVIAQTESEFVETIGRTRRILARAGEDSKDGIQGVIASWIRVERRVESRIKSLISPEEPLTPGILYVGVAALSGSVFARGRSLPTRVLLPPTLFLGALNYFLPKTTRNVNAYVYGLERAHAPALADTHDAADKALRDAVKQIRTSYNSMRGGVSHIVEDSVDGLESTTGLKLRDATIGRAQHVSEVAQDKTSSIAQNIQDKTAELQKRAAAIAGDVQSKLVKAKEPETPLELVKEKVDEAISKVSKWYLIMGKRQKAKAARVAGHSCSYTTMTSLHGERADKQVGHGGELQLSEGVCGCADSPPTPSCQALVDKHCRAKCGGSATSLDGKWCEYHTRMRVDIHKSFHELLQAYHLTSNLTPDMALVQEATDLDWVESCWEQMHSRIDALNKALLCRTCFMDRLQGGDLDFKSKKYIKGLRDARTRLQSNLRTIEDHMFTLIGSSSEYQDSIAIILSQLYSRTDQQHRCVHHNMHPDGDTPTFMFPVDREYRHQLTGNFRGNVVDGYIAAELRRFRAEILEKLGVEIIRPTSYEDSSHYRLLVRWDTNGGHRQAHIAAAYFRRLCFMESHLFVQAHRHMRTLETDQLPHITIENLSGQQLDFDKDLDPALLCMITFILSPRLKLSHLGILRDYLWWPAWSQVRTAVQDIYIDENAYPDGKRPVKPWWGKPPTPTLFAAWNDRNDPEGALTLLCGMLYEASHPQVRRGDLLTSPHWSHLGSLVRCGKCLLSMTWSADDWFAIVREFSIRRIPMYSRIFPQVMGDGVGSLWTSDLATDVVRGQSDPGRGRMGLVSHPESEKECGSSQVPKSPDFGGNYRLDETLEIAGIVMLGVVTGGPVVRPDVEDDQRRQFLESFKLYPQVWFLLTSDRDPIHKDFVLGLVRRLVLRARHCRSDLMISGIAIEHPEIEEDLSDVPPFHNASQRHPGAIPWWEPVYTGFDFMRTLAGLNYEPMPYRFMGDCPVIHLACRPTNPNGVRWLLDVILDAAIEASSVRTKAELEKFWIKSEMGRKGCEGNHEGVLSYQFGPWCKGDREKKDAAIQTSSTRIELEHEDWPSDTLIAGLQGLHIGAVETNRLQETPPHTCRSHLPTFEATGHYSPSQEKLTVNYSMSVRPGQGSDPQAHQVHDPLPDAETNSAGQSSDPKSPDELPSGQEREFSPPSKDYAQATQTDWFDLIMSEEGDKLPDLSEWREARRGRTLAL